MIICPVFNTGIEDQEFTRSQLRLNFEKLMMKILIYYALVSMQCIWKTLLGNDKNANEMYSIFIGYLQDNINNIMPKNNENCTK